MSLTVKAIYTHGVLKPLEPLPLEENQAVTVEVTPLPSGGPSGSLCGAFSELAKVTGDEFDWAGHLWEHAVEALADSSLEARPARPARSRRPGRSAGSSPTTARSSPPLSCRRCGDGGDLTRSSGTG